MSDDDLIPRLRALMAEIEARLTHGDDLSPKLAQALAVGADVGAERPTPQENRAISTPYTSAMAERLSDLRTDASHLKDYRPVYDPGFDEAVFLGSGDGDPLGHDALIRR